eukprot:scaffold209_cov396-Prasinococcus_capsulatus_cf.AAC.19
MQTSHATLPSPRLRWVTRTLACRLNPRQLRGVTELPWRTRPVRHAHTGRKGGGRRGGWRRPWRRHCNVSARWEPPERDQGIKPETEWNIVLDQQEAQLGTVSGKDEQGNTWWSETGIDRGDKGYRCRWTVMGGASSDDSASWRETWWEKCDDTGYLELGAEKSGHNAQGDRWWETWREVFYQDEWSGVGHIEKSADKWAVNGNGEEWHERWWEKYGANGFTEKGADKWGRKGDGAWWEKWGEQYDGAGNINRWCDKWAEAWDGDRWGDKWSERLDNRGLGKKFGETWHLKQSGERWQRNWGEEYMENNIVRKYGNSTRGEDWVRSMAKWPTFRFLLPCPRVSDIADGFR